MASTSRSATGFLIGALPINIKAGIESGGIDLGSFLGGLGIFGSLGAVGALAFWLTLRWSGALADAPASSE